MSASDMPPRDQWDLVEDLLAEEEAARLENLSPEQLLEEMKKAGIQPGHVGSLVDRALGEPAKVVSLKQARERRARTTIAIAFAAAAGVAAIVYTNRDTVVAWFQPAPAPTPTVPMPMSAPPGPTPEQLAFAKTVRDQAFDACSKEYYAQCEELLDKAEALDPAGEKDAVVKWMRTSIDLWRHPEKRGALLDAGAGGAEPDAAFDDSKPALGPGERPLRKHHAGDAGSSPH